MFEPTILGYVEFVLSFFVFIIITMHPELIGVAIVAVGKFLFNTFKPLFVFPGERFEIPDEVMKMPDDENNVNDAWT